MALTVNLTGPSPWGFRIFGGRDFKKAITISKVIKGSKAGEADLQCGDIILEINGENTADMLNIEAQNKIKNSKTQLHLVLQRPEPSNTGQKSGIGTPERLTGQFKEELVVSSDENQNYKAYNSSPVTPSLSTRPYSPESPARTDGKRDGLAFNYNQSVQLPLWSSEKSSRLSGSFPQKHSPADCRNGSMSSNTPTSPGHYSSHSPIDRGVPTPLGCSTSSPSDFAMNRFDKDSEVYKMIQENKEARVAPRQSNTFKMLQEVLEADEREAALQFPGNLSPNVPKTTTSPGGEKKTHICEKCGTSIVTVAVRITDNHFRHSECYTCTDCGLNLKMRGHFWVEDVMYCEKHAKERHQGLVSTQAMVIPRH